MGAGLMRTRWTGCFAAGLLVLALLASSRASAITGDITLASVSSSGTKSNAGSFHASLSADANRVAFESDATNLDPADTDSGTDVYAQNLAGVTWLVSSTADWVRSNGRSTRPSVSADGSKVAFQSLGSNLAPNDTDVLTDVFVKNLNNGTITLVSSSDSELKGNGHSEMPSISPDGSLVAFQSTATNLDPADTNALRDVYVKNLATGDVTLASTSDAGVKGNSASDNASITWNLANSDSFTTKVAFESNSTNLDPADTDGTSDIYVKDLETNDLQLVSRSDTGIKGNQNSVEPSIDSVGVVVAFESGATNLDQAKTDNVEDVFAKNLSTQDLVLASVSTTGAKGNAHSRSPSVSDDGDEIAFYSNSTNLDTAYGSPAQGVYVRTVSAGITHLASTSDDGVGGNGPSFDPSISASGALVAFDTDAFNLDPSDGDSIPDVYVKRLGAPPPPACEVGAPCGDPTSTETDTATQTITVTVPEEEGVLGIALSQATVDVGEVARGQSGEAAVGDITYTNTLGNGNEWSATVAATSMTGDSSVLPFTGMSFDPGPTVAPGSGATGTLSPGSGGSFTGTDTQPGVTYSDAVSTVTAPATAQGEFTHGQSTFSIDVPQGAEADEYAGTLQYTVIG
jgi:Tol biopolymer transport system component